MRIKRSSLLALALVASVAGRLSASTIDTVSLVTSGTMSFTDSTGTFFSMTTTLPTSDFHPFMRLQRDCEEQGYNSSADHGPNATMDLVNLPSSSKLPMNEVLSDNKIRLGMNYHEPVDCGNLLTLEELIVVVSTDPHKTGPAGPGSGPWSILNMPTSPGDQLLYQMSTAQNGSNNQFNVELDAAQGLPDVPQDLYVTIDLSNVANLAALNDASHYLYVYSRFSNTDDGFEEWFIYKPDNCNDPSGGPSVPEPASAAGLVVGALCLLRRRSPRPIA